ncbi:uncharacterized protein LOC111107283 [Crassostrea virginica]
MIAYLGKSESVLRIVLLVLVHFCGKMIVEAVNYDSYEFGQDCIVSKTVREDEQIYITYNGVSVTSECSPFSFRTKWWDGESSYKFCVKPVYFEDPDCSVRLTYITSIVGNTLRTITCLSGNSSDSFCGEYGYDLDVYFEKRGSLSTLNARFKFLLYVEKEDDESALGWTIFGVVVGVIIASSFVAALVFWCVNRKTPTKGRVMNPIDGNSVPCISKPGYPEATYTAAQSSHPNASLYPVVNFGPQYATGQIQNQQQSYSTLYQPPVYQYLPPSEFPEKQASAPPPPSYDEVIH